MRNRTALYVIIRTANGINPCAISCHSTAQRADEMVGVYKQQMIDKGIGDMFNFWVQVALYYND